MKYARAYQREDSMSVAEAVEDIKKRTDKRQDSCARKFAEALMSLAPELAFWQNVPPDIEDLSSAQLAQVPELLRQAVSERHEMDARTIGPWIYDVYGGSKKKERYGNKWDDPYPFFYKGGFDNSQLPLPLMKDFRANRKLMLSICREAIGELNPRSPKSAHTSTEFVNNAAKQILFGLRHQTDRHLSQLQIEHCLRQLTIDYEGDWRRPINKVNFVTSADTQSELGEHYSYDIMVVTWTAENLAISSKVISLEVFARKIRELQN